MSGCAEDILLPTLNGDVHHSCPFDYDRIPDLEFWFRVWATAILPQGTRQNRHRFNLVRGSFSLSTTRARICHYRKRQTERCRAFPNRVFIWIALNLIRVYKVLCGHRKKLDYVTKTRADPLRSFACVEQRSELIKRNLKILRSVNDDPEN